MKLIGPTRLHRSLRAFTLIELLVVIVILGILMAVAVPTFLRQQSKAQDSRTQQYLTTAYKAIRAGTPDTNNAYPGSTSMVSWITQSEPELTAQRGSCTTAVQSAPQDAVLVDPTSSANSLTLCSRSQSGNVWKLTATATGAPTLLDGTLLPLTFSGNEITDASRAARTQGDGRSSDSSTGIWEATTNLIPGGGFENGLGQIVKWSTGTTTITQDTSTAEFGSDSGKVVTDGTVSDQGIVWVGSGPNGLIPISASTTYTFSVWVKGNAGGELTRLALSWYDGSQAAISTSVSTMTLTTSWTRYVFTTTSPANAAYVWPHVSNQGAFAYTYWVDGAQLEALPLATPYVETHGASASRTAARVQAPASVLNSTQGWVAVRLRPGWSATQTVYNGSSFIKIFYWGDDGTHEIQLYYTEANQRWGGSRKAGTFTDTPNYGTESFAAGTPQTLVLSWTATQISISVNGSTFRTAANTTIPAIARSTFDIGRQSNNASEWFNGDFLWFAAGVGTLTNADAATINGWGNTDPKVSSFPSSAQATFVWDGSSASGSLK